MVDIEVGRARMYFSVENRAKKGIERPGYGKYSFWNQNGVILVFIWPKRSRFNFFFLIQNTNQNGVILVCLGPKRRRFGPRQT